MNNLSRRKKQLVKLKKILNKKILVKMYLKKIYIFKKNLH